MARTRQTARLSTGGWAPSSGGDSQSTQVDIFKATGKRTVVVEGTAAFHVVPDLIYLAFLVEETAQTLSAGIQKAIAKIGEIRATLAACGVSNEDVSSDSIGSSIDRTEYGNMMKNTNSTSRDAFFHRTALITKYKMRSVVRVCLEGENAAEQFSKVSLAIISSGIRSHEAPVYESTQITEHRNKARRDACENAKEKAQCILGALSGARLGAPISVTDIHCNLKDDASESFLGNVDYSYQPKRVVGAPPTVENDDETSYVSVLKKHRADGSGALMDEASSDVAMATAVDESLAEQIFVVPPIKISAFVKVIFEID